MTWRERATVYGLCAVWFAIAGVCFAITYRTILRLAA